jgi:hypothetical protein
MASTSSNPFDFTKEFLTLEEIKASAILMKLE